MMTMMIISEAQLRISAQAKQLHKARLLRSQQTTAASSTAIAAFCPDHPSINIVLHCSPHSLHNGKRTPGLQSAARFE